jgi:nucleoside-diphosphate-sugar epimerase
MALLIRVSESRLDRGKVSLVSGAAGFLGSHLVDRLLREGHFVVGLDNLLTGSLENLGLALQNRKFLFVPEDLAALPEVHLAGRLDYIWHLASPASPVHYRRHGVETMLVNSLGTKRMLDLAVSCGAAFLLASTSEVYGDPEVHPQPESYWGRVNPNGERACYDESKRFAEALTFEYRRRYGINARVVRIFNTYGPRMQPADGRVVPNLIRQALRGEPFTIYGTGKQTRSFIYVDDLIEGLYRALTWPATDGEVFNLGNPDERSVIDLARVIAALRGVEPRMEFHPLPADDPTRRCPDITRARRVLHWEPRTPLETGLRATINCFMGVCKRHG